MSAIAKETQDPKKSAEIKKSFDIEKIPFYNAVALFEQEQYQKAFELFLSCANQHNLYAPFYLQYLVDPSSNIQLQQTDTQKKELDKVIKFLPYIPSARQADAWCRASQQIILLKKTVSKKQTPNKKLLDTLEALAPYASNAGFELLKYYESGGQKSTVEEIARLASQLYTQSNLYAVDKLHRKLNSGERLMVVLDSEGKNPIADHGKEKTIIDQYATLANIPGALEALMAKAYTGSPNSKKLGIKENFRAKIGWLTTAADMGNRDIQFALSQPPLVEYLIEEDKAKWLLMAALNNEPQAQILVADAIMAGSVKFPKDTQLAKDFYEKSIIHNKRKSDRADLIALASLRLGRICEDNLGDAVKNDSQALIHYQTAAELGYEEGYFCVAVFYENGRGGLERSYKTALMYYEKSLAAERKFDAHPLASAITHRYIGDIYSHLNSKQKIDVEQNYIKAAEHYKMGANYDVKSLFSYASQVYYGYGIPKDETTGMKLFIKAAEKKYYLAAYEIAVNYYRGNIKNLNAFGLNIQKIIDYLLSVPEEYELTLSLLSNLYFEIKNYSKAYSYALKGAELNQPDPLALLGYFYEKGVSDIGLVKNLGKAFEYYQRASELGNYVAKSNLGYFLMHGYGCTKDYKKSKELLESALHEGVSLAAYNLSVLYQLGLGVDKDPIQEFAYLKMAEKYNDDDVYNSLGVCYAQGKGVTKNIVLAKNYFEKAIAMGNPHAKYSYALILINECLEKMSFDYSSLNSIMSLLSSAPEYDHAKATFTYAAMILFVNPASVESCMHILKVAQQKKPYSKTAFMLKLLTEGKLFNPGEIIYLLTHEVRTLEEQNKFFSIFPVIATTAAVTATIATPETAATIAPSVTVNQKAIVDRKQQLEGVGVSNASTTQKLYEKMVAFINSHKKNIDIKQFNHLIGKLLEVKGVSGKISQSKGSNLQYSIKLPSADKTLTFSYHPTHRSNSGKDGDYDPKRRESMQQFIKQVATALPGTAAAAASAHSKANMSK